MAERKIRQTVTTPEGRKLTLVSDLFDDENELMDTNVYDDNGDKIGTIAGGEILDFVAAIWQGRTPTADASDFFYPEISDVIKKFQI